MNLTTFFLSLLLTTSLQTEKYAITYADISRIMVLVCRSNLYDLDLNYNRYTDIF